MTPATLKRAIAEAKRFIAVANAVKVEHDRSAPDCFFFFGSKETAAAKRASMDLTRALAEMRKPT